VSRASKTHRCPSHSSRDDATITIEALSRKISWAAWAKGAITSNAHRGDGPATAIEGFDALLKPANALIEFFVGLRSPAMRCSKSGRPLSVKRGSVWAGSKGFSRRFQFPLLGWRNWSKQVMGEIGEQGSQPWRVPTISSVIRTTGPQSLSGFVAVGLEG